MRKADRHKTAFVCELGLFEWRRMPFGMCNASATFQRAIARGLRNIVNREGSMVMAYIDDIVIATETVEDHMSRLREVFECLAEASFKMRVAKCDFMKSEIKYLGRVVSAEGVKPDPKAVAKLRDWEIISPIDSSQVTHGISARIQKKISLHFCQFLKRMCYNAVQLST